jgi:hypothetical protein
MKKYLFLLGIVPFVLSSCATRIVTSTPSTKVMLVKNAPRHHKIGVIKGKRYYHWNGKYHPKTPRGYIVVKQ